QSPYRRVTCMGHLVDAEGKKMSKSGTNAVNPAEVFSSVGVDAIRWFLYTVNSPGEPKAFNTKEVQTAFRKSVLLLWNILNYFVTYANLAEVSVPAATGRQQAGAGSEQSILDRWALSRQAAVTRAVSDFMDQYDFMRAGRTVEEYINELSTWYLRRSRKRTDERFFFVLYDLLMRLTTLMAPFVPFVTEKIYQTLRSADMPESVHLMDWPEPAGSVDLELEHQMNTVRQIVELGLSVRAAEKVKVRQPLAKAYLELKNGRSIAPELIPIIADELNVLEVVMGAGEGLPVKENEEVAVAMDTALTDDLIQAGLAREFLRQIQQARKERGLKAGQEVILRAGPGQRAIIEPLLAAYPAILTDAFLKVDPKQSWSADGSIELDLNGQPVPVDFIY
ncbi:class I tRNA ligase family protein, partial [Patescibacteria group bacterium]|nr:class I tRNA ligase family protein [Patescibacteria group bacterium]